MLEGKDSVSSPANPEVIVSVTKRDYELISCSVAARITMSTMQYEVEKLSYEEIERLARGRCKISHVARGRKANVIDEIVRTASPKLLSEMKALAVAKENSAQLGTKRKRERDDERRHVRMRIDENVEENDEFRDAVFLRLPSKEEERRRFEAFYEATKPAAVVGTICGVCGRECGVMDEEISTIEFSVLRNRPRLRPIIPHPAQDLYDGVWVWHSKNLTE